MSLSPARPEDQDDINFEEPPNNHVYPSLTKASGLETSPGDAGRLHKQFLEPPIHPPLRPLSPDTLSNLSVEEYQSLHVPQPPKHYPNVAPKTWRGRFRVFWDRNLGLLYMLIAQIFGTAMNVSTRILEVEGNGGKGFHPFHVLFARMSITVFLASLYMWYTKTPYFPFGMPEVRLLLIARGMGGFFGVVGMYYSLLYLPLADATVITFLAPGLTCWACSILIKEPFTRVEKIGTLVSFVGVLFIARPASLFGSSHSAPPAAGAPDAVPSTGASSAADYDSVTPQQRLGAVGIALVGVLGAVSAYTTIRWIGKRAHPLISVNYFATWCTIVSIVAQLSIPGIGFLVPYTIRDWSLLVFLGACGFIMQFLLAAGLSYEKSSRATNMAYTSMLFAMASDKVFFDSTPSISSIMGSTLILGAAITMAIQKDNGPKEVKNEVAVNGDEEAGLIEGVDNGTSDDQMPVQDIEMRTIR